MLEALLQDPKLAKCACPESPLNNTESFATHWTAASQPLCRNLDRLNQIYVLVCLYLYLFIFLLKLRSGLLHCSGLKDTCRSPEPHTLARVMSKTPWSRTALGTQQAALTWRMECSLEVPNCMVTQNPENVERTSQGEGQLPSCTYILFSTLSSRGRCLGIVPWDFEERSCRMGKIFTSKHGDKEHSGWRQQQGRMRI